MPCTNIPSKKTNHTIHAGRAINAAPTRIDTENMTSIGLAVTDTNPNRIAVNTLAKMIAEEIFQLLGLLIEGLDICDCMSVLMIQESRSALCDL